MSNNLWAITFGDYEFILDRRALTYRLTETKTGTVWAEGLSVGWVELEERKTAKRTRFDFSECRVLSVSEKAGPQGKRILLGLDLLGVPIDVYFTCTAREIQLTVEASRDTKTHKVQEFGLLPGLCSVPRDAGSYLAIPQDEGKLIFGREVNDDLRNVFTVWNSLKMPFLGAVRAGGSPRETSALALLTDSAYASACIHTSPNANLTADWEYVRDPERRRLDLRVVPLPQGDHITIAQAYREKIIGERSHVTLRKKIRDRALLDTLIGAACVSLPFEIEGHLFQTFAEAGKRVREMKEHSEVEHAVCFLSWAFDTKGEYGIGEISEAAGNTKSLRALCDTIREAGYEVGLSGSLLRHRDATQKKPQDRYSQALERLRDVCSLTGATVWNDHSLSAHPLRELSDSHCLWDDMDERLQFIEAIREFCPIIGSANGSDWANLALDFNSQIYSGFPSSSIVYRDTVISYTVGDFNSNLLTLSPPQFLLCSASSSKLQPIKYKLLQRFYAILAPLHRLTFPAFLVSHRFRQPDFTVQEAVYSDKTRVVTNDSTTTTYESDDLTLPPMGFYVRHAQMEAHDALRVGETTFATRAWRIARSRDGLPLETSADVLRQEFPV